jgi:hypothetical protein
VNGGLILIFGHFIIHLLNITTRCQDMIKKNRASTYGGVGFVSPLLPSTRWGSGAPRLQNVYPLLKILHPGVPDYFIPLWITLIINVKKKTYRTNTVKPI